MKIRVLRAAAGFASLALFACVTRHVAPDEPVTEAALNEAIDTLRDSGSAVEVLEDGLLADIWVYEVRRVSPNYGRSLAERRLTASIAPEVHYRRMLDGPKRDVYLPYTSIRSVSALLWPFWSGIEIELANVEPGDEPGPIVIEARDAESANRLSVAIDRVRRAHLSASTGWPDDGTGADVAAEPGDVLASPPRADPVQGALRREPLPLRCHDPNALRCPAWRP
jgi:hypothetical protein